MPEKIHIKVLPENINDIGFIETIALEELNLKSREVSEVRVVKKSLDARKKPIYQLQIEVYKKNEHIDDEESAFKFKKLGKKTCHIIGAGPAGMFAALQCLELGVKPIVLERGKAVEDRIKDIAAIHKKAIINEDSNYCYGEGGAGTYSDGKLYTRSGKRGNINRVLQAFVEHGATKNIKVEAHPHIGTNKLPSIVANMRKTILDNGGEILFDCKVTDFVIKNSTITAIKDNHNREHVCENVILATGHSARDIFELLDRKHIAIEAKPFAIGVRIEHQQELIDNIQYSQSRGSYLPPSSYSLVTQVNNRGVFSFCMCPGGVVAPAATASKEVVVNGWSSSARNGQFSNSGIVVEVKPENWIPYEKFGNLAALEFQKEIEKKAFESTGSIVAPAQRMEDFIQRKVSVDLPRTSYQPGIKSVDLETILPKFVTKALRQGLIDFGKKMRGYRTNEAVLIGVESRTSSPVRIPRERKTLQHIEIKNLFPCGEGAGYAGGIVSAAIDGIKCAEAVYAF